ncbi:MAG: right-handed parallel beta-helix repeat-containing protein [bacterium]
MNCRIIFSFILLFLFLADISAAKKNPASLSWPEDTPLYVLEKADSPYIVDKEFIVEQGKTLIIEPEVTIYFTGGSLLVIKGGFKAEGRRDKKIIFTAEDPHAPWGGIFFDNAEKISHMKYCRIERGGGQTPQNEDLGIPWQVGGALTVVNSSIKVEYCIITRNHAQKGGAVYAQDAELLMQGNIIRKNSSMEGGAFYFYNVNAVFIGNKIEKNKAGNIAGAVMSFDSNLEFIRNRIVANSAGVEGSIYQENSDINLLFNNISRNRGKEAHKEFIAEIITDRPGLTKEKEEAQKRAAIKEMVREYAPSKTPEQIKEELLGSLSLIRGSVVLPREFSPYRITKNIIVAQEGSLEIQPGVILEMSPNIGITVYGRVNIKGRKTRKIFFHGIGSNQTWNNITFTNNINDNIIEWAVFTNGKGRRLETKTGEQFMAGGAIAVLDSKLTLQNCSFEINRSQYGGAVYCENSTVVIEHSSFQKNNAEEEGGALYVRLSELSINKNDFFDNTAEHDGGVISLYKSDSEIAENNMYQNITLPNKGVILCRGSRPKIRNNQILKNTGRRIVVEPLSADVEKRKLTIR